jgi:hypothetical protein
MVQSPRELPAQVLLLPHALLATTPLRRSRLRWLHRGLCAGQNVHAPSAHSTHTCLHMCLHATSRGTSILTLFRHRSHRCALVQPLWPDPAPGRSFHILFPHTTPGCGQHARSWSFLDGGRAVSSFVPCRLHWVMYNRGPGTQGREEG